MKPASFLSTHGEIISINSHVLTSNDCQRHDDWGLFTMEHILV